MCIALLSTAHPSYKLILIDNRDEYINRPTAKAEWWPKPHDHVLGGRDLLREVQGTWLGISRNGKIAVLTNYREDKPPSPDAISRGVIIKKFLTEDVGSTQQFVDEIVNTGAARDAGGFSLVCGHVDEQLAIISNRAQDDTQVPWICGDTVQTVGLSNTFFSDRSWPKVIDGEKFMLRAIRANIQEDGDENDLIEKLLDVLSDDPLRRAGLAFENGLEANVSELRKSVFCPPLGRKDISHLPPDEIAAAKRNEKAEILSTQKLAQAGGLGMSGIYATQKQTVVLVTHDDRVRYFERSLWDKESNPVALGEGDIDFEFKLEK